MLEPASHARKVPGSYDRCVALATSLELVPSLRERYGITRVANITRLDRVGIPTFCAVVPDSPAFISVYNGKGTSNEAALIGAVFEAVERQVAANPQLPIRRERVSKLRQSLDLDRMGLRAAEDLRVDCVEGFDLLDGRSVLVPLAAVQSPWAGEHILPATTSNGLASGNTLLEATYHALCEVIERHLWSLYHLRCELLPRMLQGDGARDFSLAFELAFPTGNAGVDSLAKGFSDAGLCLRVTYLEDAVLPPAMLACVAEPGANPPMCHIGLGCSLSPAHAAIRAMTEAAQSRLTDIQGAREDALRVGDAPIGSIPTHTRRLAEAPKNRWFYDLPTATIDLGAIPDAATEDLAADVTRILADLKRSGASSTIIVDLSPADIPINVVRAVVPELETACVDGRIGRKGIAALSPFLTC
jgi:ribosomal protein S12 methylthiotransferase accessory factor